MPQVEIVVHGSLRDFLPPRHRRGGRVQLAYPGRVSVKHLIESLGIPHPEIARIVCAGQLVERDELARAGCTYEVYPHREGEAWPFEHAPRFVLDGHLGRLASYLRLLGYDTLYHPAWDDPTLARFAAQGRVLLTRDQGLLKRKTVRYGYWVRATEPDVQLAEVAQRYTLARWAQPFTRCPRCNTKVHRVPIDALADRVPADVRSRQTYVHLCPSCGRVYWEGSHVERIRARFARAGLLLEPNRGSTPMPRTTKRFRAPATGHSTSQKPGEPTQDHDGERVNPRSSPNVGDQPAQDRTPGQRAHEVRGRVRGPNLGPRG
ncbi:MAG: twitching motility protein PilT [Chloroflexi bacterium]|nr:twitching motility protein PilT [Chloroflexota bacterium]